MTKLRFLTICLTATAALGFAPAFAQQGPSFTYAQVQAGEAIYTQQCEACHGAAYDGVDQAPPLAGESCCPSCLGMM